MHTPRPRLKEHALKCWPEYFAALSTGHKTFEIRDTSDRDFRVGDLLVLREFVPCTSGAGAGRGWDNVDLTGGDCRVSEHPKGSYTGRSVKRLVTYITGYGQPEGQVVMGLAEWHDGRLSGRPCPSGGRVREIADQLYQSGAYTQAQEIEALGVELQRERETREGLLQEIRALRSGHGGGQADP